MINFSLSKSAEDAANIVLIHGLFGDKDNLNVLRRELTPLYNVMSLDLPDHGLSDRTSGWEFRKVVESLRNTFAENDFYPDCLIGHSLGGKVAMAYALTYPSELKSLIVADIAPVGYTPRHNNVFKALNALDMDTIKLRKDAMAVLSDILVEPGTAEFLLKSLAKTDDKWDWRFNLKGLERDYSILSSWPFSEEQYIGPITFIKGEKSDYINPSHADNIKRHFPHADVKMIGDTGHWLHAEKPRLFNKLVLRILDKTLT